MMKMTKVTAMKPYCRSPESPKSKKDTARVASPAVSSTRLSGPLLIVVRVVWVTITFVTLGLFLIALPARYNELQHTCTPGTCNELQLTVGDLTALKQSGLSLQSYALYNIPLEAVLMVGCLIVAIIIFWGSSDDWMALFASLTLVIFGATLPPEIAALVRVQPQWHLLALFIQELSPFCLGTLLYLFPSGRFVPRWTVIPVLGWGVWSLVRPLFMQTTPFALGHIENIIMVGFFAVGSFALLYRYTRVSGHAQRQQTKWVVFGLTALVAGILLYVLIHLIFAPLSRPGLAHVPGNIISVPLCLTIPGLCVPLTIGIAIRRYHLWDIDIIIKRTLVYTPLTTVLVLIYVVLVIVLQFLVSRLIGTVSNSAVAIVLSTLTIAALFQPLRRALQKSIDRRFYRRKYDAEKTLEAFSATLSREIDLHQLSEQLVAIVQETIQPTEVSLWLFQPERNDVAKTRTLPEIGDTSDE